MCIEDSASVPSEENIPSYPELYGLITTEEVIWPVKRLKKEKSLGVDNM